jgi:hypothetical protein
MSDTEIFELTEKMISTGGSFVQSLGVCIRRADATNRQKLLEAFPNYVQEYSK